MMLRFFLGIALSLFLCACNAEGKCSNLECSFNESIQAFSESLSNGDKSKFKGVANPAGVYLVRRFTSGNLGGRGAELSASISATSITEDMKFLVKDQTPFDLKVIFPGLLVKSYKEVPQYIMKTDVCNLGFDRWSSSLKEIIAPLLESGNGDPIILKAASECWVYAEAQVIDDMLVGGFAVFKNSTEKVTLVSIIDLL